MIKTTSSKNYKVGLQICKIKLIGLTAFYKAEEEHFEYTLNKEKILVSLFWLNESLNKKQLISILSNILLNTQNRLEKKDLESFLKTEFEKSELGKAFKFRCILRYHDAIKMER